MLDVIKTRLVSLKGDRRGVTAVEYGVIAGVLAGGLYAVFHTLGVSISTALSGITF